MKTLKAKLAFCALLAAAIGGVSFASSSEARAWGAARAPGPVSAENAVVEKAQYYRYRRYRRCRTQCVTWSRYGCLRWRTYCYYY